MGHKFFTEERYEKIKNLNTIFKGGNAIYENIKPTAAEYLLEIEQHTLRARRGVVETLPYCPVIPFPIATSGSLYTRPDVATRADCALRRF